MQVDEGDDGQESRLIFNHIVRPHQHHQTNVIAPLDSSLTGSGGKFMDTKPGAKKAAASTPPKSEEQPKESEEDTADSSDDTKAATGKGGKLDELTDEALAKERKEIQDISSRLIFCSSRCRST